MPEEQTDDLGTQVFIFDPDAPLTELTADIGPGFGNQRNKYSWSGTMFDGDNDGVEELYVGTFNVELSPTGTLAGVVRLSTLIQAGGFGDGLLGLLTAEFPKVLQSSGGEIWRYDFGTENWSQVVGPDLDFIDNGDAGFREMMTFNDMVFASTSKGLVYNVLNASDNAAKIAYSSDGITWNELTGGPLDPEQGNSSIRAMEVVTIPAGEGTTEVMLVGTENVDSGAQLWMYDEAGNWTKITSLPIATVAEVYQTENGDIFIGTWATYQLLQLEFDPTGATPPTIVPRTPVTFDDGDLVPLVDDEGVMQMIEYDGYFYMGSVSYLGGTSLVRTQDPTNPMSWEVITLDGFQTDGEGDEMLNDEMNLNDVGKSIYSWQMAVVEGSLYIGDFNGEQAQLIKITTVPDDIAPPANGELGTAPEENIHYGLKFEIMPDVFGSEAYGLRKLIPISLDEDGLPITDGDPNALLIGSADPFWESTDAILGDINFDDAIVGTLFPENLTGTADADVIIGLHGADTIEGNDGYDMILGDGGVAPGGDDSISGGDGFDTIFGELGDDTIDGDDGDDFIIGGSGGDVISGGDGVDFIMGDVIVDDDLEASLEPVGDLLGFEIPPLELLFASLVDDLAEESPILAAQLEAVLELGTDFSDPVGNFDDVIYGNCGADIIFAGYGQDTVYGGAGRDIVFGGDDNDLLMGGFAEDIIDGGMGDDTIDGGAGLDVLSGGEGQDTFRFSLYDAPEDESSEATSAAEDTARDRIIDFSGDAGDNDKIDLSSFATTFIGTAAFSGTAGEVRYDADGDDALIYVDANGNGLADFSLQLGEEEFELEFPGAGNTAVLPPAMTLVESDFILGDTPILLMDEESGLLEQEDESIAMDYMWAIRQAETSQIGTLTLRFDATDRNTIHQLQLASGVVLLDRGAENVTIGGDGNILFLSGMECESEITLNFEVAPPATGNARPDTNFPENAVVLTSHVADDTPTVDEFDPSLENSLIAIFGGEGISVQRSQGAAEGDETFTPGIDEGSAVSGFGLGDAIIIEKDPEERPEITIEPLEGEPGGAIVTINGVKHVIQFEPGDLGGEVMVLDMGGEIKFQYMTYLPELSDGQRVNPDLVNGVVNPDFLTGVVGRNFEVTLEDLGLAGYDNVVGSYVIAEDGKISDVRILFENANTDGGDSELLTFVDAGSQIGFFLIQDGADWLSQQADYDGFTFVEGDGDLGNANADQALFLSVDGVLQSDLTILHSYDADLNEDGMVHVLTGINEGDQSITIGFEDMTNGGDYDFEDVGLLVEYSDIPV
ncbi:MAG: DUF4114 domain-containing protein [Pseudopelagicola sp.]|nr:DUF4114 domain-containing protein [Pseudopelagicola sp.]